MILLLITGCATSSGPSTTEPGTREVSRYAVIHEGPELAVGLGFYQATRSIGDEWLIGAVELTASAGLMSSTNSPPPGVCLCRQMARSEVSS